MWIDRNSIVPIYSFNHLLYTNFMGECMIDGTWSRNRNLKERKLK